MAYGYAIKEKKTPVYDAGGLIDFGPENPIQDVAGRESQNQAVANSALSNSEGIDKAKRQTGQGLISDVQGIGQKIGKLFDNGGEVDVHAPVDLPSALNHAHRIASHGMKVKMDLYDGGGKVEVSPEPTMWDKLKDAGKDTGKYFVNLYRQGQELSKPLDSEKAAFDEKQKMIQDTPQQVAPVAPKEAAVLPSYRIDPNSRYGSREGEKRIDTSDMTKPLYDDGGKVEPKKVDLNDGKHVSIIAEQGERVLTPEQTAKWDKDNPTEAKEHEKPMQLHGAPADFPGPVFPEPSTGPVKIYDDSSPYAWHGSSKDHGGFGNPVQHTKVYDEGGEVAPDETEKEEEDRRMREASAFARPGDSLRNPIVAPEEVANNTEPSMGPFVRREQTEIPKPMASGATDHPLAGGAVVNAQGDKAAIDRAIIPPNTTEMGGNIKQPAYQQSKEPVPQPDPMALIQNLKGQAALKGDLTSLGSALIAENHLKPMYGGPEAHKGEVIPLGQPIPQKEVGQDEFHAKMNFYKQQYQKALDEFTPEGREKAAGVQQAMLNYEKEHAWGTPESAHPGVLGKVGHILGRAAEIGSEFVAPGASAAVPGSMLNMKKQGEQAQRMGQEASEEIAKDATANKGPAAAKTATPQEELAAAYTDLRTAQANGDKAGEAKQQQRIEDLTDTLNARQNVKPPQEKFGPGGVPLGVDIEGKHYVMGDPAAPPEAKSMMDRMQQAYDIQDESKKKPITSEESRQLNDNRNTMLAKYDLPTDQYHENMTADEVKNTTAAINNAISEAQRAIAAANGDQKQKDAIADQKSRYESIQDSINNMADPSILKMFDSTAVTTALGNAVAAQLKSIPIGGIVSGIPVGVNIPAGTLDPLITKGIISATQAQQLINRYNLATESAIQYLMLTQGGKIGRGGQAMLDPLFRIIPGPTTVDAKDAKDKLNLWQDQFDVWKRNHPQYSEGLNSFRDQKEAPKAEKEQPKAATVPPKAAKEEPKAATVPPEVGAGGRTPQQLKTEGYTWQLNPKTNKYAWGK